MAKYSFVKCKKAQPKTVLLIRIKEWLKILVKDFYFRERNTLN